MKRERGITLVALIVTIIILIILSAIAIRAALGDNGLIQMSTGAAEKMKISEYQEELTGIGVGLTERTVFNGLAGIEYLNKFKEEVDKSEIFKYKQLADIIENGEENKLRIVTREGYVFDVTEKEINYVGKKGETEFEPVPDLQEESIVIEPIPSEWTKGKVAIGIKIDEDIQEELSKLIVEYTTDPSAKTGWTKYDENNKLEVEKNGVVIFARVRNSVGEASKYTASTTIQNIDTIKPNNPTEGKITERTSNSIKVTAKAIDNKETEEKPGEESGIAKIRFEITGTIEGEITTKAQEVEVKDVAKEQEKEEVELECLFEGLTTNSEYTITATAIDRATNESDKVEIATESTTEVPGGNTTSGGSISFDYSPDPPTTKPWTNGNVNVTITSDYTSKGYKLQYSKKATPTTDDDWTDYTVAVPMTANGSILARLKDSSGQTGATATGTVSNIDKVVPSAPTGVSVAVVANPKANNKKNNIQVTATAHDTTPESNQTGQLSGLDKILFSINGTNWFEVSASSTDASNKTQTYTFEGQEDNIYTVRVKAKDNAGNESAITNATAVNVDTVAPSTPGITFTNLTEIQTKLNSTLVLSGNEVTPCKTGDFMKLSTNKQYLVSFDYKCASGTNKFDVDLYPDGLPQIYPVATTTLQHMDIIFASQNSAMENCRLRFFDDVHEDSESDITISNMKFYEIGTDNSKTSYTSDILVTITHGADTGSGATGVKETKYNITGAETKSGTIPATQQNAMVVLKTNGTYTINAYTIDKAENKSVLTTEQVIRDSNTAPVVATISSDKTYDTSTKVHTITITATGRDAEGGELTYTLTYGTKNGVYNTQGGTVRRSGRSVSEIHNK